MKRLLLIIVYCLIGVSQTAHANTQLDVLNKQVVRLLNQGRYTEAIPLAERAVTDAEALHGSDNPNITSSLSNLAVLYKITGRYEDALPLYKKAIALEEINPRATPASKATTLNNFALLYKAMGRYEDALPLFMRALSIKENIFGKDTRNTAININNLAGLYVAMGLYDDAMSLYLRVLEIKNGLSHELMAVSLNNLAMLYAKKKHRYDEALKMSMRSLDILENKIGADHPYTASSLDVLAYVYEKMGRPGDALLLLQRALKITERAHVSENPDIALRLNNLAVLYESMGLHAEALPLYRQAVRIVALVDVTDMAGNHGNIEAISESSANLAHFLEKHTENVDEAIFYYKLSVNARQRMRDGVSGLDKSTRDAMTRKLQHPYHLLARLLIQRGRVPEAERVLLLLKESELTEFLRRNGGASGELAALNWTPEEEGYKQVLDQVARQWREFEQKRAATLERVKRCEIAQDAAVVTNLEEQRGQLDTRTGNLMAEAAHQFTEASRKAQETRQNFFELAPTALSDKLGEIANDAPGAGSTAGLALLPDERGLMLLVTTERGTAPLLQKISETALNQLAAELRQAILERKDYKAPARALYDALIAPAEAQLGEQAGIKQWAILPFGALRNLPFAALIGPDGRHLIERYALVKLTANGAANFDGLEKATRPRWQGVAMGASQSDPEFGNLGLPGVRREVCGVVRDSTECPEGKGVVAGHAYLDPRFTPARLRHYLGPDAGEANFLHIATHFKTEKSILLLGDGERLTSSQILAWKPHLGQYDLLALSACDSGLDAGAVESLGGAFRSKGAKAVLATLWPVADVGAAPLMVEFYRRRGEQRALGKAEALRQAQVEMLNGRLRAEDGKTNMSHPYFWAPYVLMGNWL